MTLNDFNAMDERRQIEAVANGALISDPRSGKYTILLYQIDGIDVFIDRMLNEIVGLRSLSNIDQLFPYLNKIDITELMV